MKRTHYLIWLGITTAAGTAVGMLSSRRRPEQGGLMGAAAGFFTGSVTAELYRLVTANDNGVKYYSKSSPLYEKSDEIGYV